MSAQHHMEQSLRELSQSHKDEHELLALRSTSLGAEV